MAAKAAAEAQKQSEEYGANLNMAVYSMLSGASDAETCGNLIKQVWYNAIYKESDSKTNKYTKPNGYYVSDFNDALQNLFSDSSFSGQIADINSNTKTRILTLCYCESCQLLSIHRFVRIKTRNRSKNRIQRPFP